MFLYYAAMCYVLILCCEEVLCSYTMLSVAMFLYNAVRCYVLILCWEVLCFLCCAMFSMLCCDVLCSDISCEVLCSYIMLGGAMFSMLCYAFYVVL